MVRAADLPELQALLLVQFDIPVRFTQELGPTGDADRMPRVHRLPCWAHGSLPQRHVGLRRGFVGLAFIAFDTRQHAVVPCGRAASRAGLYVVNRQFFRARLNTAVLASVVISLVDVSTTECDDVRRHTVIAGQCDDFWNAHPERDRLNEQFAFARNKSRPIIPRILLKVGRIDEPSPFGRDQCE